MAQIPPVMIVRNRCSPCDVRLADVVTIVYGAWIVARGAIACVGEGARRSVHACPSQNRVTPLTSGYQPASCRGVVIGRSACWSWIQLDWIELLPEGHKVLVGAGLEPLGARAECRPIDTTADAAPSATFNDAVDATAGNSDDRTGRWPTTGGGRRSPENRSARTHDGPAGARGRCPGSGAFWRCG